MFKYLHICLLLVVGLRSVESISNLKLYLKENENLIFSFQTENKKILSLTRDRNDKYIVYRFGTKDRIELQYPGNLDSSSWNKFYISHYLRGGGLGNEGLDLSSVMFSNNSVVYRIGHNYSARFGVSASVEISISNISVAEILAQTNSIEGSILGLFFEKKLPLE